MSGKDSHPEASRKRKRAAAISIDSDSQESPIGLPSSSRLQVPIPPASSSQLRPLVKELKAGRDYSQVLCYNCGNLGHYSNRCPSAKNLIPHICHRCRKPGHSVAQCSASECKKFRILRELPKANFSIQGQSATSPQGVNHDPANPVLTREPQKELSPVDRPNFEHPVNKALLLEEEIQTPKASRKRPKGTGKSAQDIPQKLRSGPSSLLRPQAPLSPSYEGYLHHASTQGYLPQPQWDPLRRYPNIQCFRCGQMGHFARKCSNPEIDWLNASPPFQGMSKDSLQIPGQLINCSQVADLEQVLPASSVDPPKAPKSVAESGHEGNLGVNPQPAHDPEQPGRSRIVAYYDTGYFDLDV